MKDHANTKQLQSRSRIRSMGRLDALGGVILNFRDQGLDVSTISKMIGCNKNTLDRWLELGSEKRN